MPLEGDDHKNNASDAAQQVAPNQGGEPGSSLPPSAGPPNPPPSPPAENQPSQSSGKWRENTKFGLEVFGVLLLFAYTWFSCLQWLQIRYTNSLTARALDGNDIALKATLEQMRGQVSATNRVGGAAETANGNNIETDRPWVGIVITVYNWEVGKVPTAIAYFINDGRRPAKVIEALTSFHLYETFPAQPDYGDKFTPADTRATGLILPNANLTNSLVFPLLTQEFMNELAPRRQKFFVFATIKYRDARTNEVHWTHGCVEYFPGFKNVNYGFINCRTYNDIDPDHAQQKH